MMSVTLGTTVNLSAELRDLKDALQDASNVRLLVLPPGQATPTVVAVTVTGLGKVEANYTPATAGIYRYRFETTGGDLHAASEGSFQVQERTVPAP